MSQRDLVSAQTSNVGITSHAALNAIAYVVCDVTSSTFSWYNRLSVTYFELTVAMNRNTKFDLPLVKLIYIDSFVGRSSTSGNNVSCFELVPDQSSQARHVNTQYTIRIFTVLYLLPTM